MSNLRIELLKLSTQLDMFMKSQNDGKLVQIIPRIRNPSKTLIVIVTKSGNEIMFAYKTKSVMRLPNETAMLEKISAHVNKR
jgi:hypothetical protein